MSVQLTGERQFAGRYSGRMTGIEPERQSIRARFTWRDVCAGIGWVGMFVAVFVAWSIFARMFGGGLGVAFGGGTSVEEVSAIRRDAALLAWGAGLIAVLALLGRRWVLMPLALLLCGACVVLLGGVITTR